MSDLAINTSAMGIERPPVILCGAFGGGTSFATRLLRHCGLFVGADAGAQNDRKYHESYLFWLVTLFLLKEYYAVDMPSVDSLERNPDLLLAFKRPPQHDQSFYETGKAARDWLTRDMDQFWGGSPRNVAWGWKNPRNSLCVPFWEQIFPEAKYLIICKSADEREKSRSAAGKWFRSSTDTQREIFFRPEFSREAREVALTIQFEDLIEDCETLNRVLLWCGLEKLDESRFQSRLEEAGLENPGNLTLTG